MNSSLYNTINLEDIDLLIFTTYISLRCYSFKDFINNMNDNVNCDDEEWEVFYLLYQNYDM